MDRAWVSATAGRMLDLVGGAGNVTRVTRCWARLRLELADFDLARDDEIGGLDGVVLVVRQAGQLQVVLRSGLREVHDELARLVAER